MTPKKEKQKQKKEKEKLRDSWNFYNRNRFGPR